MSSLTAINRADLEKLYKSDPSSINSMEDVVCFWCGRELQRGGSENHTMDCPWRKIYKQLEG
jgi:hypothetical protein